MKFYTDHPIVALDDVDGRAPIREIKILSYDGDKYCKVEACDSGLTTREIKAGYVYVEPKRLGDARQATIADIQAAVRISEVEAERTDEVVDGEDGEQDEDEDEDEDEEVDEDAEGLA